MEPLDSSPAFQHHMGEGASTYGARKNDWKAVLARSRNKKKRPSGKSQPAAATEALAYIRKHGSILTGLENFKIGSSAQTLRKSLPTLLNHKAYSSLVWPKNQGPGSQLTASRGFAFSFDDAANVTWLSLTLAARVSELGDFLTRKAAVDNALLYGEFDAASLALDEIDERLGESLWSYETRLNIMAENGDERGKADFLKRSRDFLPPLFRYLIFWIDYRSSEKVTATSFYRSIDNEFPRTTTLLPLIKTALGANFQPDLPEEIRMVAWADMFPLLDRYLLFRDFLAAQLASAPSEELRLAVGRDLKPLTTLLDDPVLDRIAIACGNEIGACQAGDLSEAWEFYSTGQYDECLAQCRDRISKRSSFQAIALAVRAEAQLDREGSIIANFPDGSIARQIYEELPIILAYRDGAIDAVGRLKKLAAVHARSGWSPQLLAELEWAENDARLHQSDDNLKFQTLRCGEENPKYAYVLSHLDPGAGPRYLEKFYSRPGSQTTGSTLSAVLQDKGDALPENLSGKKAEKSKAIALLRAGSASDALAVLQPLLKEDNCPIEQAELRMLAVHGLVELGEWHDAAEIAATMLIGSSYAAQALPVSAVLSGLENAADETDELDPAQLGVLPVTILADFAVKAGLVGPELRFDAFSDFLLTQDSRIPSDLIAKRADFDRPMMDHFFARVCLPEVLDQSLYLTKTEEVENERARLIVALTSNKEDRQISSETASNLGEELQTIRMRQAVRDAQRQLDQSKIYVNVDGVRSSLGEEMIEDWNRYRVLLLKSQSDQSVLALEKELKQRFGDDFIIALRQDFESYDFLKEIMDRVALEFSQSKEFGLNSNLSTNVRHGSIMRELRGPFATRKLVTNKATHESDYADSELIEELGIKGVARKNKLNEIFRTLSAEIDALIDLLNDELLRIHSAQYPNGLFDYHVDQRDAIRLHQVCRDLTNFDDFMEAIFEWLWVRTEENLGRVREALKGRILQQLDEVVKTSIAKVQDLGSFAGDAELLRSLNLAREDGRNAVERVADWFTRAKDQAFADYEISVALEAAKATVQSYYAALTITFDRSGNWSRKMAGWTLPGITRLFALLVENAAQHSGIETGQLSLGADISWQDEDLTITFSNPLGGDIDKRELDDRIGEINQNYRRDKAADAIATEKGSGFAKIWNLLEHHLERDHAIEVRRMQDQFEVQVMLTLKGIIA